MIEAWQAAGRVAALVRSRSIDWTKQTNNNPNSGAAAQRHPIKKEDSDHCAIQSVRVPHLFWPGLYLHAFGNIRLYVIERRSTKPTVSFFLCSAIGSSKNVRIFKLQDPERGQTTLDFNQNAWGESLLYVLGVRSPPLSRTTGKARISRMRRQVGALYVYELEVWIPPKQVGALYMYELEVWMRPKHVGALYVYELEVWFPWKPTGALYVYELEVWIPPNQVGALYVYELEVWIPPKQVGALYVYELEVWLSPQRAGTLYVYGHGV